MDNAGPGLRTLEVGSLFDGGEEMIDVVQRHAECEAQITCNNAHGTPRTLRALRCAVTSLSLLNIERPYYSSLWMINVVRLGLI